MQMSGLEIRGDRLRHSNFLFVEITVTVTVIIGTEGRENATSTNWFNGKLLDH